MNINLDIYQSFPEITKFLNRKLLRLALTSDNSETVITAINSTSLYSIPFTENVNKLAMWIEITPNRFQSVHDQNNFWMVTVNPFCSDSEDFRLIVRRNEMTVKA